MYGGLGLIIKYKSPCVSLQSCCLSVRNLPCGLLSLLLNKRNSDYQKSCCAEQRHVMPDKKPESYLKAKLYFLQFGHVFNINQY